MGTSTLDVTAAWPLPDAPANLLRSTGGPTADPHPANRLLRSHDP